MADADVTVIMPAYNAARFVDEAVRSILGQEGVGVHLIVVDDGSTDGTADIVEAIRDPRIELLRREHRGNVPSVNEAHERVATPYVARLDADDVSLPGRLAAQIAFLERHPEVDLVSCGIERLWDDVEAQPRRPSFPREANHSRIIWMLYFRHPIAQTAFLGRTDALRRALPYDPDYPHSEDYELLVRNRHRLVYAKMGDRLVRKRRHSESVSSRYHEEQVRNSARAHLNMLRDELGRELPAAEALAVRYPAVVQDAASLERGAALVREIEAHELARPGLDPADAAWIRSDTDDRLRGLWFRAARRSPVRAPVSLVRWLTRERLGAPRSAARFARSALATRMGRG